MNDFGSIMKQAQDMQQKLQDAQARLADQAVEGRAGGGLVTVTMSGAGALKSVAVDPSLLEPSGAEMLSDLIVAAHAEAKAKLDAAQAETMRTAMGPLGALMGGGGLPSFPGL